MAMKTTPVRKLQDEYLLNEFEGLARWAGDDFAIHQITHNALRRQDAARKEILRRMALSQQIRNDEKKEPIKDDGALYDTRNPNELLRQRGW